MQQAGAAARGVRFAQCPMCQGAWETRTDFLGDPRLELIGYQVAFTDLAEGLFLFNHACGTTLARTVGEFQDLYRGPLITRRATGSDECPGYCLRRGDLRPCPAECDCAAVRAIMQVILHWPGRAEPQAPAPPGLIG